MATTSIPHRWKYDVFVSFRGEDLRTNFMDHLFNDFKQKGIYTFRDNNDLPRGEYISPQLYKAIEESRFLIVIFSKNYASSSWCLKELVKIIKCQHSECPRYEVRIVFYDVKPDVVRKQTDSYADAFAKHQVSNTQEIVNNWKEALVMAANLVGWDLKDMTNGYESTFVNIISKDIPKKLCDGPLDVGENLVGVDFHSDQLNLLRFVGSDKVNMIGICGISGIGKTTLSKAIYNLMYVHFEGSCFCEDVQGVTKRQGIIQVQMHMINKILKIKDLEVSGISEGIMVIKQRVSCKPILLVLDNVDDDEQLEALAGSPTWFCPGSLIIFTGKDKQLLRSHRVDEIHDMEFLDGDKSLELFYSFAFKEKYPSIVFKEVSEKVVKYVQGHPLALKVLGRFLYGKSVCYWESELERLKVHPNEKIQRVLRLSYDGLDPHQKNILLDIACLFVGENSDFVASILDGCNCFAVRNMQYLVDMSLITISSNNSLKMHDLIQAMAREIVREESIMTGKQRRLWNSSEVYNVFSEKKVPITEAVEVLVLSLEKFSQKVQIDANDFARMKRLRILKIYHEEKPYEHKLELEGHNVIFSRKNLYHLSNELSLFYWHGYPFEYLPSDFYPENIVAIDLSYSNIKHFWTTPKCFRRLKVMKLRYCCNLTTTPDFSEITSLEVLDLEGCVNLVTVHPSILLNMRDCRRAAGFPSKVETDSLQVLNRSGCLNGILKPFGLDAGLKSLVIWNQQHPQRSVSLEGLQMLKSLNFSYCNLVQVPESIGGLSCLKKLNLRGNNLLEVPESIGGLSFLEELNLAGNNFTSLPGSLSQLSNLESLYVNGCKKLEVLSEVPPCDIGASDCTSLREVPGSSKYPFRNRSRYFKNCPKLFKNVTIDSEGSISKTQCLDSSITSQGSIHQLSAFLGYAGLQANRCEFFSRDIAYSCFDIMYHANSIPEWFTNRSKGNHVKVELPSDWCFNKFRGYGFCVVFKRKKPYIYKGCSVKNFDGASMRIGGCSFEREVLGIQDSYMIWLCYMKRDTQEWKEAKNFVTFSFQDREYIYNEIAEAKECGVRLICDEDIEQEADLSMLQGLPTPTTQHGVLLSLCGANGGGLEWSW